ncbi:Hsp33 family molecular chaperone HslO [Bombella sp. TMW 2.2559]|uniref:Hsp33 family molecular chaperone HslO n=1 Tax=Bombella dulcis TaxID=2967339 RepID=A0ABT3WE98_9PROT|nr:Hsp33 family molecular chaperone HslO [Bombella dulcis]MCX5616560.1 Hsp33 family molecular chaperone HslO [Bombella dulcis]
MTPATETTTPAVRPHDVSDLTVAHAITPFHLGHVPVRGRLITLGPLAGAILSRHAELPEQVRLLGGQALALVAAMSTALKFKGSFSLQVKGDGPVSLFLADCTDAGELRFTARMAEDHATPLPEDAPGLLGKGYMAFTVDQGPNTELYQGIVGLEGKDLAEMAVHYFQTSEQHDCAIHLFSRHTEAGWQAGALVLERLPDSTPLAGNDDQKHADATIQDLWETACTFGQTLTADELFDPTIPPATLISRLFGTLNVELAPTRPLSFGCRCNRTRLRSVLERFGKDDLDHMAQDGVISMKCHFCNTAFTFNRDNLLDSSTETS